MRLINSNWHQFGTCFLYMYKLLLLLTSLVILGIYTLSNPYKVFHTNVTALQINVGFSCAFYSSDTFPDSRSLPLSFLTGRTW